MRKFEVGDVVNWIYPSHGVNYTKGPYLVQIVHKQDYMQCGDSVRLTTLDGSPIYFASSAGTPTTHDWILEKRLRLDPFLSAARKAVLDDKT